MCTINRICFTIIQFILLFSSSKQLHSKQAITTIKAVGKTIKAPLFKQISNAIKKPIIKAFDNTIKNSVSMFRRNKNATKSFACGIQEKNFGMQYNFGSKYVKYLGDEGIKKFKYMAPQAIRRNKQLVRTRGKKNMWMRSAGWMKGKEIRSLINMVSKSKPQLPLLFVAGGLGKLTRFSILPDNYETDKFLKEKEAKNKKKVEYYREKHKGKVGETKDEQLLRMYDKQSSLPIESSIMQMDILKSKQIYNSKSSRFYRDTLIDNAFITEERGPTMTVNKNPEELQSKMKFPVDLDKVVNDNIVKQICSTCLKRIKFYCINCKKCILKEHELPKVNLPIDIHIVKHTKEPVKKSSVYPLIFLSPKFKLTEQPGKFQWKDVKELEMSKPGHNYVLYPHKNARLMKDQPKEEQESIKSIKIVDCFWGQTKSMMENIPENTKFIKQEDYESTFWRYQWHNGKCLSSAEATYYLVKEYDQAQSRLKNKDENLTLDSILFFYFLQYKQIKKIDFIKGDKKNQKYFDQIQKLKETETLKSQEEKVEKHFTQRSNKKYK